MRLRRTAAGGIAVVLVLAGCSSSGDGAAGSSVPETTTTSAATTTTTEVATTTTTVAPTTSTSTTTVVADATAADPNVLAQQLQAVLDRFRSLYVESRTDPALPFENEAFMEQMLGVVTRSYYGVSLIPAWQQYRQDATSVRNGPSGPIRDFLTGISVATPDRVEGQFCNFDDGVTFDMNTGAVVDDAVVVHRANASFVLDSSGWLIDRTEESQSSPVPPGANPCADEWLLRK